MTRLLIVEDEEHIANVLKFNLEAEGYAVDVEDNGEAALQGSLAPCDEHITSWKWIPTKCRAMEIS